MKERNYKTMEVYHFEAQEGIPNHPELPVLIYSGVLDRTADIVRVFERIFSENKWIGFQHRQLSGICHFQLEAHEVLGVTRGSAAVELGGRDGKQVELNRGDLLLLPAGTGLRLIVSSPDFQAVSAYPEGQMVGDFFKGKQLSVEQAALVVESTPRPTTDPFFGREGPLFDFWYE